MLAAPLAYNGLRIRLAGDLVSQPYVEMTRRVMREFGVAAEEKTTAAGVALEIARGQCYRAADYSIEPDASAASYFWGAAAICGGQATVEGLNNRSIQGDVAFVECLRRMGCDVRYGENAIRVCGPARVGLDVEMKHMSDTVQTLAAVALFVDGPTRIRGVAHNRHKETDRIADLARELRRVGAQVDEFDDGMLITPQPLIGATIETYNDHRMAMSMALVGLRQPGIVISNPGCTAKTFPRFFQTLARLY
jgi:3-phosphoshikimate 1-carboxyvinyltransferase